MKVTRGDGRDARARRRQGGGAERIEAQHQRGRLTARERISALLDMTLKDVERVLYFENYIVTDPGDTDLQPRELLSEERYRKKIQEFGDGAFKVTWDEREQRVVVTAPPVTDARDPAAELPR